jgi:hypothetical protein
MGIAVIPAAGGGAILRQTTFTSSGTFTLPAGYGAGQPLIVDIEICGGGGGGGSGGSGANTSAFGGAGGGSGICLLYKGISLTANATVTIGAGGTGGAAVSAGEGNAGANGGTSDVNSLYYAPGGGGGVKGLTSTTNRVGGTIRTQGFILWGGHASSTGQAPGSAGGSAGAKSNSQMFGDNYTGYGGSKGQRDSERTLDTALLTSNYDFSMTDQLNGSGIATAKVALSNSGLASTGIQINNELTILQRGGGGGGSTGNTSTVSGGGAAGTIISGGQSGYVQNTSVTGSKNGASATDNGCGGGGGAGNWANAVTSGSGGNGAPGYCKITYWA